MVDQSKRRRAKCVPVYFSHAECERLDRLAANAAMKRSTFIRHMVLKRSAQLRRAIPPRPEPLDNAPAPVKYADFVAGRRSSS